MLAMFLPAVGPPARAISTARRGAVRVAWTCAVGKCLVGMVCVGTAGCATSWPTSFVAGSRKIAESPDAVPALTPASSPLAASTPSGVELASAAAPQTSEEALAGVLDELIAIRAINPEAQSLVMEELRQAKPEHYPLVVRQFRAALAYRQQLAERDAEERLALVAVPDALPEIRVEDVSDHERGVDAASPLAVEASGRAPKVEASISRSVPHGPAPEVPLSAAYSVSLAGERDAFSHPHAASRELTPPPVEVLRQRGPLEGASDAKEADASYGASANRVAAFNEGTGDDASGNFADWRAGVDLAIQRLSHQVSPMPRSTDELHDHMRLRALHMLAGHDDAAYEPIPGAAASPQEFWSQQLFALATYLDDGVGADDKQRAAATLVHLDEARDKLAESATLLLRNAAFVKSVDGYGAYEALAEAKFRPSEQVTVYAEVENFRSDSTSDGYRTRLATSYQVLDDGGKRVEGGEFPDVEDLCRNRRRDFHMQFAIPLPERIYPGRYQLEIVITDQLSNKIGQQRIPLEIVD